MYTDYVLAVEVEKGLKKNTKPDIVDLPAGTLIFSLNQIPFIYIYNIYIRIHIL